MSCSTASTSASASCSRSSTARPTATQMMNSVAPVWDGNETWLVLGGGGLFAVFPLAYAVIMPALYVPIIAMLLALIFRGVAFEFRWRTERGKFLWDWAFAGGSLVAAFAQGVALGALVQGIPVASRAYAGGWWDWLTPFSAAHRRRRWSSAMRCSAPPGWSEDRGRAAARGLPLRLGRRPSARSALIGVVSLWTPFLDPDLSWRAGSPGRSCSTPRRCRCWSPAAAFVLFRGLRERQRAGAVPRGARRCSCCPIVGLGISFYPYIVPPSVTIWEAAAPDDEPGLPAGRRRGPGAADPALHRLFATGCSAAR